MVFEKDEIVENRYKIINLINEGGMSYIYLAQDLRLHSRYVALKVLKHAYTSNRILLQQEAATLIELSHPNLPKVYDYFILNEQCDVLVLEFIDGVVLTDIAMQLNDISKVNVILQIVAAMCYLHNRPSPIIHRDIKPSNIMVDSQLNVKIIDFGISAQRAKLRALATSESNEPSFGTPEYMAPELLNGGKASMQSDIYSFALVILFMWSIKRPSKEERMHIEHYLLKYEDVIPASLSVLLLSMLQPSQLYRTIDLNHVEKQLHSLKYDLIGKSGVQNKIEALKRKQFVIAIANLNRCAGSTTVAICLAQLLAKRGKRVTYIELAHPQSNIEMSYLGKDLKQGYAKEDYCVVNKHNSSFYFITSEQLNTTLQECYEIDKLVSSYDSDIVIYDLSSMEDRYNTIKQLQPIHHLVVISSSELYITNEHELVNAIKYLRVNTIPITHVANKLICNEPQSILEQYITIFQYMQLPFIFNKHHIEEMKKGKWLHPKSKLNIALFSYLKDLKLELKM